MHQGVGLDLQTLAEILCGENEVVVRRVVVGAGVQRAAQRFDLGGNLIGAGAIGRPLEKHMLDDVGDADLAVVLVKVAGAQPKIDCHDRRIVLLRDEHRQPVRKLLPGDLCTGHAVPPCARER